MTIADTPLLAWCVWIAYENRPRHTKRFGATQALERKRSAENTNQYPTEETSS